VTVIEATDPLTLGEDVEVIRQVAVQLDDRPLRARRVIVRLGTSVLLFHSTNLPIRTRTVLRDGLVAYVGFGPHAAGTMNGLPVGPDLMLAAASGVRVECVVAADYESAAFLVPPDDVRAHLRSRQRECLLIPNSVELWKTNSGAGPSLFEWGRSVAEAAVNHPDTFDDPQTNAVARLEMFETLLSNIGSAVEAERAPRDGTRRAYSRIVQLAEDYTLAHAAEHLYVTHLCKAASVSERTLQSAFREILGMTPVEYLTRLRLHRVRQALRAATPHSTTVKAEALKWGFWHLSDFSRTYKACFGELPSETLHRQCGHEAQPDNSLSVEALR
jgi:AraC-like DNA-binding protein